MESFPNFRKLWGKIEKNLEPGNYKILVNNSIWLLILVYNVTSFNGKKSVILTTASSLGSGSFFGYTLLLGAAYCFIFLVIIYAFYLKNKNKTYTLADLKWD